VTPFSPASPITSQATPEPAESLDALVMRIAALKDCLTTMEADYKAATAQLLDAHAQGLVRSEFTAYDTAFKLTPGRTSWSYDSDVTDQVKEIQQWAQSNQKATMKQGTPFWTLKRSRGDS
jgi:hypothetical protein